MEQTHGTWGNRTRIFQNDTCLVTVLDLEPNQRCSWHAHETAYNQFYVVVGMLGVKTDKGYTTKLFEGQSFTVEPMVYHEFQTYDMETTVVETAYSHYDENDIHREKLGGPLNASDTTDEQGTPGSV